MWAKMKKVLGNVLGREVAVANHPTTQEPLDIGLGDEDTIICSNCATPLTGGFCASCGQKNTSLTRPIWYLISDLTEDIISKDSKLFRSIGQIIFHPGSLTRDFMDGKRARFIPPVRFYLLCTLTFFITLAVADVAIWKIEFIEEAPINQEDALAEAERIKGEVQAELAENGVAVDIPEGDVTLGGGSVTIADGSGFDVRSGMFQPAEPSADAIALPEGAFDDNKEDLQQSIDKQGEDSLEGQIMGQVITVLDGLVHVSQDPRKLNGVLNDWLSRVMIFLLPFFALLLRFFYWKRENCLMKQLVFSLHFHSAVFLMMTFLIIAQSVWGAVVSSTMFFAIVPLYLFIAMKVANRQGYIKTIFKFLSVSLFYIITLSITVGLTLMLSLSEI